MQQDFDLVIIGAGITGTSILFNLLNDGFKGRVLIIDKLDGIAEGSTALGAGGFRNIWSTEINMQLTTYSIGVFKTFKQDFGISIGYEPKGYLFTYYAQPWKTIVNFKPEWDRNGVRVKLLTPEEIEKIIPGLKTSVSHIPPDLREMIGFEEIVGGLFGEDCGYFDPTAIAKGYVEQAKKNFANQFELRLKTEVKRLLIKDERTIGIELTDRTQIHCEKVIAACGAWVVPLLKESGLEGDDNLPINPIKRMLFITNLPDFGNWENIPLTIIDKGIYFRFEAGNLLVGHANKSQAPGFDTTAELSWYKDETNPYMQERIPGTEYCNVKSMWAGLYDDNYKDHNAILGEHIRIKNLFLAVGFSGHGSMEGPAVGKCVSELINFGGYKTIDAACLSMRRFKEGNLVLEKIVI